MPRPAILPSNTSDELFPDSFGANAIVIAPLDATATPRAFETFPFIVSVTALHTPEGLIPPLELIIAAPSGKHTRQELVDVPLAVALHAEEAGEHQVTVREIAHNRWWGSYSITATGDDP